jgi:hypothetical protein
LPRNKRRRNEGRSQNNAIRFINSHNPPLHFVQRASKVRFPNGAASTTTAMRSIIQANSVLVGGFGIKNNH